MRRKRDFCREKEERSGRPQENDGRETPERKKNTSRLVMKYMKELEADDKDKQVSSDFRDAGVPAEAPTSRDEKDKDEVTMEGVHGSSTENEKNITDVDAIDIDEVVSVTESRSSTKKNLMKNSMSLCRSGPKSTSTR